MSLKGVANQVVFVLRSTVLVDGAVVANELLTRLTVELELLTLVQGAVKSDLLQGIKLFDFALKVLQSYHLMRSEIIPLSVDSGACGTNKFSTVTAVAGCWLMGLTFVTLDLLRLFDFLKSIFYLEKVVDVEC